MKKTTTRVIAMALILLMALALIPMGARAEGTYTVHFVKNAEDAEGEMQDQSFPEGESMPLTACAFTRSDYTCIGWTTAPDDGVFYSNGGSYTLSGDLTLYAKWQENPLVIFRANYENGPENVSQSVPYQESTQLQAPSFTRSNYSLAGWYVKADGSGTYYNGSESVTLTQDLTLFAHWTRNTVSVSFEAGEGSGTMGDVSHLAGDDYTVPTCAFTAPEGKEFAGWKDANGQSYQANETITGLAADLTLTAQWTRNTVSVSFEAGEGSGTMGDVSHLAGDDYTVPTCAFTAPEGKEFAGWKDADDQSYQVNVTIAGLAADLTLTAQWNDVPATTYTLSFDANDASATGSTTAMTNTTGSFLLPDCGSTKQGYTFQGWSAAPQIESYGSLMAPGSTYSIPTGETSDTLYAQWAMSEYASNIVTFDPDGGSLSGAGTRAVAPGQPIGALPSASREGYTFAGWQYNGQAIDATFVPQGNLTVKAAWTQNESPTQPTIYTVHFNSNGGTGEMADATAQAGTPITAPACTFTAPAGMRFAGWNTLANGSGGSYSVGSTIGFNAEFSETEKTLYAQWSSETVIVTLYVYGSDYGAILYNNAPAKGTVTVPKGSTTAFTYAAVSGCRVKSVKLNGVDVTGQSQLNFDRNSTLAVTFEKGFPGTDFTATYTQKSMVIQSNGTVQAVYDITPLLKETVFAPDRQHVYPTTPVSFVLPYPKTGMNKNNYNYTLIHVPDSKPVEITATDRGLEGSSVNFSDFDMSAAPKSNTLIGDVTISGSPIVGNPLTATVTNTNNTGTLTYTWKRGGTTVGTGPSYTTTTADNGATLVCEVTSSVQSGTISATVYPATKPKPAVLSYIYFGDSTKTGEIGNVSPDMEYALSVDGPWYHLTGNTLTGLTTPGTYYFRLADDKAAIGSVLVKAFSWVTADTMYGKGSVTPATQTVENGSNLVLEFTPRKNYQVAEVRVNGVRVPNMRNATYLNLKNITGRAEVKVGFYYAGNTPHTGDDSHLTQWCELAALSLVGLAAVIVLLKRKIKA